MDMAAAVAEPHGVAEMFMANEPLKPAISRGISHANAVAEMFMANEPLKLQGRLDILGGLLGCRDVYGE